MMYNVPKHTNVKVTNATAVSRDSTIAIDDDVVWLLWCDAVSGNIGCDHNVALCVCWCHACVLL